MCIAPRSARSIHTAGSPRAARRGASCAESGRASFATPRHPWRPRRAGEGRSALLPRHPILLARHAAKRGAPLLDLSKPTPDNKQSLQNDRNAWEHTPPCCRALWLRRGNMEVHKKWIWTHGLSKSEAKSLTTLLRCKPFVGIFTHAPYPSGLSRCRRSWKTCTSR